LIQEASHVNKDSTSMSQKFLDWPPRVRTANGIALCH
jgi:hypothetical protein